MSNEAKAFFSLMIGQAMDGIKCFYKKSLENTTLFYKRITEPPLSEPLRVQPKGDVIPVIGFHHPESESEQDDWAIQAQDTLSKNALEEDCPLFVRASFPFPHSTVVECGTALRWIAGLDTPSNMEKYPSIINQTSKDLFSLPPSSKG